MVGENKLDRLFEEVKSAVKESSNPYPLIAITGKMGSGKDTVGGELCARVNGRAGIKYFFSKPLKTEVNDFISRLHSPDKHKAGYILNTKSYRSRATEELAREFDIEVADCQFIYDKLIGNPFSRFSCLVTGNFDANSYDRTPEMRRVLQYWGTEIRRKQDENYWVSRALTEIARLLKAGEAVFLTDARFANEVSSLKAVGGIIIRLNISEEEQARRIKIRDGIDIPAEAKSHPSETDLDDKEFLFDIIVNSDIFKDEVDSLIEHLAGELKGR